uniref:WD_REPEATS_REGION domain-containing protein n=1 Tax=Macrostomum lignano TaxID=282301 RepID=A0A1I8H9U9_9PLAT
STPRSQAAQQPEGAPGQLQQLSYPYLNLFKELGVGQWNRSECHGGVASYMDQTVKSTAFSIQGAVSASNYIQLPRPAGRGLQLQCRYLYVQFRPSPGRHFVLHVDLAAAGTAAPVRLSVSSLYKRPAGGAAAIKLPFVFDADGRGRLLAAPPDESEAPAAGAPCPEAARWTLLRLDLDWALRVFAGVRLGCLRGLRLCACMSAAPRYQPNASPVSEEALPRAMAFFLGRGERFEDRYDFVQLPEPTVEAREAAPPVGPAERRPSPPPAPLTPPPPQQPQSSFVRPAASVPASAAAELRLSRVLGCTQPHSACWTQEELVFPCHALVVAQCLATGRQRFFTGHTDSVGCVAVDSACGRMASGQRGLLRLWDFAGQRCLAHCPAFQLGAGLLAFSPGGLRLAGTGRDAHGRFVVTVWQTDGPVVRLLAKACSDQAPVALHFLDEARVVTCGRGAVRFWRVKGGGGAAGTSALLRSAPAALGEYAALDFTAVCPLPGPADADPLVLACARSGHVLELGASDLAVRRARRLLPSDRTAWRGRARPAGIEVSAVAANESFCVTGSADGFLRVWPLDFSQVLLEAEHESPVVTAALSRDGASALAATAAGCLGVLDVARRAYRTLVRSPGPGPVASAHLGRDTLATVSAGDKSLRLWSSDRLDQCQSFGLAEPPCRVAVHPRDGLAACGFRSGHVRLFDLAAASMLGERRSHSGAVSGLAFSACGLRLFSCGSDGGLSVHDASAACALLRSVPDVVARVGAGGSEDRPSPLAVDSADPGGSLIAYIGPTGAAVVVAEGATLAELIRVDVTMVAGAGVADAARALQFGAGHLLVATEGGRLLRLERRSGRLASQLSDLGRCDCLCLSPDGRYCVAGVGRQLKLFQNCSTGQVQFSSFLGHSGRICALAFSADGARLMSVGEAVLVWDFMAPPASEKPAENLRTENGAKKPQPTPVTPAAPQSRHRVEAPVRDPGPGPATGTANPELADAVPLANDGSSSSSSVSDCEVTELAAPASSAPPAEPTVSLPVPPLALLPDEPAAGDDGGAPHEHPAPSSARHFRSGAESLRQPPADQRRYLARPGEEALRLRAGLGAGSGVGAIAWLEGRGRLVYAVGCQLLSEDLETGLQARLCQLPGPATAAAASSDSRLAAFCCLGGGLRIFDAEAADAANAEAPEGVSMALICRPLSGGPATCAQFSRDDRYLLTVGNHADPLLQVWLGPDWQAVASHRAAYPVNDVCWRAADLASFVSVGTAAALSVWSVVGGPDGSQRLQLEELPAPDEAIGRRPGLRASAASAEELSACTVDSDDAAFVAGGRGRVSVWSLGERRCVMHWEAEANEVCRLALRPGGLLLCGAADGAVKAWDVRDILGLGGGGWSGGRVRLVSSARLDGAVLALLPDSQAELALAATAASVWCLRVAEGAATRLIAGHAARVAAAAPLPGLGVLATGDASGAVRIFDSAGRQLLCQLQPGRLSAACLCLAADALYLAAGYGDGHVRAFTAGADLGQTLKARPHAAGVSSLALDPGHRFLVSGCSDGLLALTGLDTGLVLRVLRDHRGSGVACLDIQPDSGGCHFLASAADRRLSLWACADSADSVDLRLWLAFPLPAFAPGSGRPLSDDPTAAMELPPALARFCPADADLLLLTGCAQQPAVDLYSLAQRRVVRSVSLPRWPHCLDASPSGRLLLLGSLGRLVTLLDLGSGCFQDFVGHAEGLSCVRFGEDGRSCWTAAGRDVLGWDVLIRDC